MLLSNFGWTSGSSGGGGGGGGTVTQINPSTGMNFTPITTVGGIAIDVTKVPYYAGGFSAGFAKWNGAAWVFDNSTYLTTASAASTYYPLVGNPSGFLTTASLTSGDITSALGYTPVNKAGDTMTGFLILNADPSNALGAATKQYVDNLAGGGINFHEPTYAASTANLVANYNNGVSGVGATLTATSNGALILDGIDFTTLPVLPQPYRVLIWQQTNQIENGIYTVTSAGGALSTWQLTRATDADNSPSGELSYGDFSLNINGTQYGGYGFIMNATGTINIGSSNITYVQYNIAQGVIAGTGITESPANTININLTQVPYYSSGFGGGGFAIYSGGNWTFDTNTYLTTVSAAATYLTIANAAATYYPLVGNPSGFLTSASLSGYVPYTGATTNVDLGVHNLTTPTLYGSSAASANLTLSSTSDVTKGKIVFGTSAYDEVNNRLGIGTLLPSERLTVDGNIAILDGHNIVLATVNGTKIGTSTTQKLGFFNALPVIQPPATSTPQGIADALNSLGLLASSTINSITLTTTGSTGVATYTQATNTLNIPEYSAALTGYVPTSRNINTTAPLAGGGNLSSDLTLSIPQANGSTDGYLSQADWTTFNGKFNLPALTSGSVLFSNGTTITQDNTNFFWDNSNKRLGIGTNSPSESISLVGGNFSFADNANIVLGTSNGTKIGTTTSQKLGFYNKTPITQPPAITTVQQIADTLVNLGLLATSTITSLGSGIVATSTWNVVYTNAASINANVGDYIIVDASNCNISLPAASANARVGVKMINSSVGTVQILATTAAQTIDGQVSNVAGATTNLYIYNQWDAYNLIAYTTDGGSTFKWAIES